MNNTVKTILKVIGYIITAILAGFGGGAAAAMG